MEPTKVIQGTDFLSTIVLNDDLNNPYPLATFSDFQAYIYTKDTSTPPKKTNVFTYRKTLIGNDYPIQIIDTFTQGILLSRDQTLLVKPGTVLYIESVILLPGATFYENSLQKIGNDVCLCEIVASPNPKSLL